MPFHNFNRIGRPHRTHTHENNQQMEFALGRIIFHQLTFQMR